MSRLHLREHIQLRMHSLCLSLLDLFFGDALRFVREWDFPLQEHFSVHEPLPSWLYWNQRHLPGLHKQLQDLFRSHFDMRDLREWNILPEWVLRHQLRHQHVYRLRGPDLHWLHVSLQHLREQHHHLHFLPDRLPPQ